MGSAKTRSRTVSIYKSGSSLVIRLPKKMIEDMKLQPGQHLLIVWSPTEARIKKVEAD